jgi:hypothetical protein
MHNYGPNWRGPRGDRELELMQEAGIHRIDVLKIATMNAGQILGEPKLSGVRTGTSLPCGRRRTRTTTAHCYTPPAPTSLSPTVRVVHRGGVRWTIKAAPCSTRRRSASFGTVI